MLQYIIRRIFYIIPTLIVVSVVSFTIIELPPGDFLTSYITQLELSGESVDQSLVDALKKRYGLDQPLYMRYIKWVWEAMHGNFGVSFEWDRPVSELIWDRLLLTVVISLSTLMFTWIVALPIGIYSATHQYSMTDYVATFLGFIGLATPNFMIALVLMWFAFSHFGVNLSGLFSEKYIEQPWSYGKFVDMLKHLWVPMIVLGTSGTAGLIRTMRANLLDELYKPYVETARAKGLGETKLILKYPVRVALNPFVSTIGWTLPQLVSGSTIISIVLSLPTTGPLFFKALLSQDMYLAGTFVMMLSFLTVLGTLISDILLAWLDPRIRYEG
ncbi:MAG: ABC transporter permease [Anaerolineae bacterium]|nr:ABC transporter permease [Anaerolineae bacterium]